MRYSVTLIKSWLTIKTRMTQLKAIHIYRGPEFWPKSAKIHKARYSVMWCGLKIPTDGSKPWGEQTFVCIDSVSLTQPADNLCRKCLNSPELQMKLLADVDL